MKQKKLKIYFTSDVHGYFYPTTYGDMIEKPMGLFGCAEDFKKDEDTLILDGGDILQGSAFAYYCHQVAGSPEVIADIMNDCGYDYYTLGNHDFNYGLDYQKMYRDRNHGVCVCQNITDDDGNTLFPWKIHVMKNGLRIGIVGIVTDYVNIWEKEENLKGIQVTDPYEAARTALEQMKTQTDLTICIYHGGFECDLESGEVLSKTTENIGYRICKELDFDILLTGHQHMSVPGRNLFGTYTVQPCENAKEYQYLEVIITDDEKNICSELHQSDAAKGRVLADKYRTMEDSVQTWLNQPVGHLSHAIMPEEKVKMALYGSPIADFFNRIQLHFSGAMISSVGLANEIAGFRSEVSTRDIIATYTYPNTLVVCEITGKQLKMVMERSAEYFAYDKDGNVCVSDSFLIPKVEHYNYDYYMGVDFKINPKNPIGSRIEKLSRNGKPVLEDDKFTICLNNYRYSGAGGYDVYTECPLVKEINVEMVELIMDYFHEYPYIEV